MFSISQTRGSKAILKQIVDFARWDDTFSNAFRERQSLAITGKPGLGKSTYLRWALSLALDRKLRAWFNRVIVLDRLRPLDWPSPDDLHRRGFRSETTAIILDGPFEPEDNTTAREQKLRKIRSISNEFCLITTMREDEYLSSASTLGEFEQAHLAWHKVAFWQILQKRLVAWGGPKLPDVELTQLEDLARIASDGAPLYLELVANSLAEQDRIRYLTTSDLRRILGNELPRGVEGQVWQIITRICGEQPHDCDPVLLVIKLLERFKTSLSNHIQRGIVTALCTSDSARSAALDQLNRLARYFAPGTKKDPISLPDTFFFSVTSHWREALGHATAAIPKYSAVAQRYLAIDHEKLRDEACMRLVSPIERIISIPQVVLCSDVIKLKASSAIRISDQYIASRHMFDKGWPIASLDNLVFDAWLTNAFTAQSVADKSHHFDQALRVSQAFDITLRQDEEKRPLNHYITFLRSYILPFCESTEFETELGKISRLCERLIALDRDDASSRKAFAQLHMQTGNFVLANRQFEDAVKLPNDLERCLTLIEWSDLLRRRAKDRRAERYAPKVDYLLHAMQRCEEAESLLSTLRSAGGDIKAVHGDIKWAERSLALRFAQVLTDRNLLDEAEARLRKAIPNAPGDLYLVNTLADILLRKGRLPEARRTLDPTGTEGVGVSNPISLQILGRVLCAPPAPDFAAAETALRQACAILNSRADGSFWQTARSARAYHDLARLYLAWAEHTVPGIPTPYVSKAEDALAKALSVPRNVMWLGHYGAVVPTLARLGRLGGRIPVRVELPPLETESSARWYAAAESAWYACDDKNVISAFTQWLHCMREMKREVWAEAVPTTQVCSLLRWVGVAYRTTHQAMPYPVLGRYYASLCYTLWQRYPLSATTYPGAEYDAAIQQEVKLIAARCGDEVARHVQISLLGRASKMRWLKKRESWELNAALRAQLLGHSSANKTYSKFANKAIDGKLNMTLSEYRMIGDALSSNREYQLASQVWMFIAKKSSFPERLFATILAEALAQRSRSFHARDDSRPSAAEDKAAP